MSDLKLSETLPEELMPEMPEIAHLQWVVNRDYHFPSAELSAQLGYTPYPKTPISAELEKVSILLFYLFSVFNRSLSVCVCVCLLIHCGCCQVVGMYQAFADEHDPVEIRICIAGSDNILNQVANAYVSMISRQTDTLKVHCKPSYECILTFIQGIILRFFLIPFKHNLLSAFLARHDSWYL